MGTLSLSPLSTLSFGFYLSLSLSLLLSAEIFWPQSRGHYVPELADLILENNNKKPIDERINIKGLLVGNPGTEDGIVVPPKLSFINIILFYSSPLLVSLKNTFLIYRLVFQR